MNSVSIPQFDVQDNVTGLCCWEFVICLPNLAQKGAGATIMFAFIKEEMKTFMTQQEQKTNRSKDDNGFALAFDDSMIIRRTRGYHKRRDMLMYLIRCVGEGWACFQFSLACRSDTNLPRVWQFWPRENTKGRCRSKKVNKPEIVCISKQFRIFEQNGDSPEHPTASFELDGLFYGFVATDM